MRFSSSVCFRPLTAFALMGAALGSPIVAWAQSPFNSIVAFGDSLSDSGNIYNATLSLGGIPRSSSYVGGLPTSNTAPYFGGRFSNGPVWVESLAANLGVSLTNFSFSGAMTSTANINNPLLPPGITFPGMQTQVSAFIGSLGGANANSGTLFSLFGGANDYFAGVTDPSIPVANLLGHVDSLLAVQAQNILVLNLPNLGQLPASSGNPTISAGLTALSQGHNALLAQGIQQRRLANPNRNIYLVDMYGLFTQLTTNPSAFGLTNVTSSYVSSQGQPYGLNPIVVGSGPINNYLFMDEVHPTQTGHNAISSTVTAAIAPEPSTLLLAVPAGLLLLGVARRRTARA